MTKTHNVHPVRSGYVGTVAGLICLGLLSGAPSAWAGKSPGAARLSPTAQAALHYAEAVGHGEEDRARLLDFSCLYREMARTKGGNGATDTETSGGCLDHLKPVHSEAVPQTREGILVQWPGRGRTVFFSKPLVQYPISTFVMDLLGQSPPGSGFEVRYDSEQSLPQASFPSPDGRRTVSVPTKLVRMTVSYKDPLTSPIAYAPGTFQWTSTVPRPRIAIRSVSLQVPVVSGLRRHGYPSDVAVINLPVSKVARSEGGVREAVPFVTESGHALENTVVAWQPNDMPGLLIAAVARAALFPELDDRMAMLNRVLLIDPKQPDALTALSNDLYVRLLRTGDAAPPPLTKDPSLARRLAELSWNTYAQTTRMDLSLGMDMGGLTEPTAADFLYRMIPAMETLAQVRPQNLDNRMHLGIAYRWNNDQPHSIQTHEALVRDLAAARPDQRARALLELSWSRINKVAWNRILDDPDIQQAYREAEEAFTLTGEPLDKFLAAYTMAYSQVFMPNRDLQSMLQNLTEARKWFSQTPGATAAAWTFVMGRDAIKPVVDANPSFQPLLAASEPTDTQPRKDERPQ